MGGVLIDDHETVFRFGYDIGFRHLSARDPERMAGCLGYRI